MLFRTLEELNNFFEESPAVAFYGLGNMSLAMLGYLTACGFMRKLKFFVLTSAEDFPKMFCGKPVYSVNTFPEDEKHISVFIATAEASHDEIIRNLLQYNIDEYFAASDEVMRIAQSRVMEKSIHNTGEDAVIEELISIQTAPANTDMLFIIPPYWDIYSPYSAIPSIVGKLKGNGISSAQADFGLECFHYLLSHAWKPIALSFLERRFYENEVCRYKHNPYSTYASYCEGMWFFQEDLFPIKKIKQEYTTLNVVQRSLINLLYQRILFIDAKSFNFNLMQNIHDALSAFSWEVFYAGLLSDKMKLALTNLPEIIGISATGLDQFLPACKLATILKKLRSDVKLILGGSCADLFVESLYPFKEEIYDYFDYVVVGEGETAVCELYECLKKHCVDIGSVPNVAHISGNEVSYAKSILEDVESLPLADYSGLDLERYMAPRPILPYQASRGCHYGNCAFCNHNSKYRHNYRVKSPKKIVRELVQLSKSYGIKDIQFVDEAIRPDQFAAIVDEMERVPGFKNIMWFYYSRVSRQYTAQLLQKAYRYGCRMVMFGIETFNQRLLNFIKKGIHADTSRYCLNLFHENQIKTYAWLMGNLPSETLEEVHDDMVEVENNISNIDAGTVGAFCLEINTDMYHDLDRYNILSVNLEYPEMFSSHSKGILIDKRRMLDIIRKEYVSMLRKHFFYKDRYQVYFGIENCSIIQ